MIIKIIENKSARLSKKGTKAARAASRPIVLCTYVMLDKVVAKLSEEGVHQDSAIENAIEKDEAASENEDILKDFHNGKRIISSWYSNIDDDLTVNQAVDMIELVQAQSNANSDLLKTHTCFFSPWG